MWNIENELGYTLNVDYVGEFTDTDDIGKSILSLRIFIESDKIPLGMNAYSPLAKKNLKMYGVNLNSEGTRDYEYASESLGNKLDKWLSKRFPEQAKDFNSVEWLLHNDELKKRFIRSINMRVEALKVAKTYQVEDNRY